MGGTKKRYSDGDSSSRKSTPKNLHRTFSPLKASYSPGKSGHSPGRGPSQKKGKAEYPPKRSSVKYYVSHKIIHITPRPRPSIQKQKTVSATERRRRPIHSRPSSGKEPSAERPKTWVCESKRSIKESPSSMSQPKSSSSVLTKQRSSSHEECLSGHTTLSGTQVFDSDGWSNSTKSFNFPGSSFSLDIDGMINNKSYLPCDVGGTNITLMSVPQLTRFDQVGGSTPAENQRPATQGGGTPRPISEDTASHGQQRPNTAGAGSVQASQPGTSPRPNAAANDNRSQIGQQSCSTNQTRSAPPTRQSKSRQPQRNSKAGKKNQTLGGIFDDLFSRLPAEPRRSKTDYGGGPRRSRKSSTKETTARGGPRRKSSKMAKLQTGAKGPPGKAGAGKKPSVQGQRPKTAGSTATATRGPIPGAGVGQTRRYFDDPNRAKSADEAKRQQQAAGSSSELGKLNETSLSQLQTRLHITGNVEVPPNEQDKKPEQKQQGAAKQQPGKPGDQRAGPNKLNLQPVSYSHPGQSRQQGMQTGDKLKSLVQPDTRKKFQADDTGKGKAAPDSGKMTDKMKPEGPATERKSDAGAAEDAGKLDAKMKAEDGDSPQDPQPDASDKGKASQGSQKLDAKMKPEDASRPPEPEGRKKSGEGVKKPDEKGRSSVARPSLLLRQAQEKTPSSKDPRSKSGEQRRSTKIGENIITLQAGKQQAAKADKKDEAQYQKAGLQKIQLQPVSYSHPQPKGKERKPSEPSDASGPKKELEKEAEKSKIEDEIKKMLFGVDPKKKLQAAKEGAGKQSSPEPGKADRSEEEGKDQRPGPQKIQPQPVSYTPAQQQSLAGQAARQLGVGQKQQFQAGRLSAGKQPGKADRREDARGQRPGPHKIQVQPVSYTQPQEKFQAGKVTPGQQADEKDEAQDQKAGPPSHQYIHPQQEQLEHPDGQQQDQKQQMDQGDQVQQQDQRQQAQAPVGSQFAPGLKQQFQAGKVAAGKQQAGQAVKDQRVRPLKIQPQPVSHTPSQKQSGQAGKQQHGARAPQRGSKSAKADDDRAGLAHEDDGAGPFKLQPQLMAFDHDAGIPEEWDPGARVDDNSGLDPSQGFAAQPVSYAPTQPVSYTPIQQPQRITRPHSSDERQQQPRRDQSGRPQSAEAQFGQPASLYGQRQQMNQFGQQHPSVQFLQQQPSDQLGQQAPQFGQQAPQFGQQAPQFGQQAPQFGQQAPQFGQQPQAAQFGQQAAQFGQQSQAAQYGQQPQSQAMDQFGRLQYPGQRMQFQPGPTSTGRDQRGRAEEFGAQRTGPQRIQLQPVNYAPRQVVGQVGRMSQKTGGGQAGTKSDDQRGGPQGLRLQPVSYAPGQQQAGGRGQQAGGMGQQAGAMVQQAGGIGRQAGARSDDESSDQRGGLQRLQLQPVSYTPGQQQAGGMGQQPGVMEQQGYGMGQQAGGMGQQERGMGRQAGARSDDDSRDQRAGQQRLQLQPVSYAHGQQFQQAGGMGQQPGAMEQQDYGMGQQAGGMGQQERGMGRQGGARSDDDFRDQRAGQQRLQLQPVSYTPGQQLPGVMEQQGYGMGQQAGGMGQQPGGMGQQPGGMGRQAGARSDDDQRAGQQRLQLQPVSYSPGQQFQEAGGMGQQPGGMAQQPGGMGQQPGGMGRQGGARSDDDSRDQRGGPQRLQLQPVSYTPGQQQAGGMGQQAGRMGQQAGGMGRQAGARSDDESRDQRAGQQRLQLQPVSYTPSQQPGVMEQQDYGMGQQAGGMGQEAGGMGQQERGMGRQSVARSDDESRDQRAGRQGLRLQPVSYAHGQQQAGGMGQQPGAMEQQDNEMGQPAGGMGQQERGMGRQGGARSDDESRDQRAGQQRLQLQPVSYAHGQQQAGGMGQQPGAMGRQPGGMGQQEGGMGRLGGARSDDDRDQRAGALRLQLQPVSYAHGQQQAGGMGQQPGAMGQQPGAMGQQAGGMGRLGGARNDEDRDQRAGALRLQLQPVSYAHGQQQGGMGQQPGAMGQQPGAMGQQAGGMGRLGGARSEDDRDQRAGAQRLQLQPVSYTPGQQQAGAMGRQSAARSDDDSRDQRAGQPRFQLQPVSYTPGQQQAGGMGQQAGGMGQQAGGMGQQTGGMGQLAGAMGRQSGDQRAGQQQRLQLQPVSYTPESGAEAGGTGRQAGERRSGQQKIPLQPVSYTPGQQQAGAMGQQAGAMGQQAGAMGQQAGAMGRQSAARSDDDSRDQRGGQQRLQLQPVSYSPGQQAGGMGQQAGGMGQQAAGMGQQAAGMGQQAAGMRGQSGVQREGQQRLQLQPVSYTPGQQEAGGMGQQAGAMGQQAGAMGQQPGAMGRQSAARSVDEGQRMGSGREQAEPVNYTPQSPGFVYSPGAAENVKDDESRLQKPANLLTKTPRQQFQQGGARRRDESPVQRPGMFQPQARNLLPSQVGDESRPASTPLPTRSVGAQDFVVEEHRSLTRLEDDMYMRPVDFTYDEDMENPQMAANTKALSELMRQVRSDGPVGTVGRAAPDPMHATGGIGLIMRQMNQAHQNVQELATRGVAGIQPQPVAFDRHFSLGAERAVHGDARKTEPPEELDLMKLNLEGARGKNLRDADIRTAKNMTAILSAVDAKRVQENRSDTAPPRSQPTTEYEQRTARTKKPGTIHEMPFRTLSGSFDIQDSGVPDYRERFLANQPTEEYAKQLRSDAKKNKEDQNSGGGRGPKPGIKAGLPIQLVSYQRPDADQNTAAWFAHESEDNRPITAPADVGRAMEGRLNFDVMTERQKKDLSPELHFVFMATKTEDNANMAAPQRPKPNYNSFQQVYRPAPFLHRAMRSSPPMTIYQRATIEEVPDASLVLPPRRLTMVEATKPKWNTLRSMSR